MSTPTQRASTEPKSESTPCRYCGQAPEIAEYGMCGDCYAIEELDAAAYVPTWEDESYWAESIMQALVDQAEHELRPPFEPAECASGRATWLWDNYCALCNAHIGNGQLLCSACRGDTTANEAFVPAHVRADAVDPLHTYCRDCGAESFCGVTLCVLCCADRQRRFGLQPAAQPGVVPT